MNRNKQSRTYNVTKVSFPDREKFWQHFTRLACYFTGPASLLMEEDRNKSMKRYLVSKNDTILACFSIIETTVINIAYIRTETGIKPQLLDFLVNKWITLVSPTPDTTIQSVKLLFPDCDRDKIEEYGFQFLHQRDRLTINLSDWEPNDRRNHSWTVRPTKKEDAPAVTKIYIDAYQGTLDEQIFSPSGIKYEEELQYISSFLNNTLESYPMIESASLVAVSDQKLVGFCYVCLWRGVPLIWDFAVPKKYQRQGIGTFLLINVLKKLKIAGYTKVALFVTQGNEASRRIYKSLGFKIDTCNLMLLEKQF